MRILLLVQLYYVLVHRGNKIHLRDLSSTNGTFVNDSKVEKKMDIRNGDTLFFGEQKFRLHSKKSINELELTRKYLKKNKRKTNSLASNYYLTKREHEVLFFLFEGLSTKEIVTIIAT